MVKAQIHAGGRGKGGGVKIARSPEEVKSLAKMIGMTLVTHQTGPEGKKVQKVFIEQGCDIAKEYYVACLVDRARIGRVTMMASSEGGVEIEEVAAHRPEAIIKVSIDPAVGLMPFHGQTVGLPNRNCFLSL